MIAGHTRVLATIDGATGESITALWRLDQEPPVSKLVTQFDLLPGTYLVSFTAVRDLTARIYSRQRFDPDQQIPLKTLRVRSNRVFELDGTEITGDPPHDPPNTLTNHLFAAGPISPVDRWTLELSLADNPFLRSVTPNDNEQVELGEIDDAVLLLEYETGIR